MTGNETANLPRRIRDMYTVYGRTAGATCRTCAHLRRLQYARVYFKCELGPLSHGPGMDWRTGWPACDRWIAMMEKSI